MYFVTESTWNQTVIFLGFVFAGMVLGLVFAFLSGIKVNVKKKFFKIVQDVVFCLIFFIVVGMTLYMLNDGKIELYMAIGIIIGFLCSLYLFEKPLKNTINKANKLIYLIKERLIIHKK